MRTFISCCQKSAGITAKFLLLWTQKRKEKLAADHTNWLWLNAAEIGSPDMPCEWWIELRSNRLRSARMRLSSEIFRNAWNKSNMKKLCAKKQKLTCVDSSWARRAVFSLTREFTLECLPTRCHANIIYRVSKPHNCTVWWTNLPSSLLQPLLTMELLIISWSFCS